MAHGSGTAPSVLTERPPADRGPTSDLRSAPPAAYPSAPQHATQAWAAGVRAGTPEPLITSPGHYPSPLTSAPSHAVQVAAPTTTASAPAPAPAPSAPYGDSTTRDGTPEGNQAWYDSLLGGRQYEVLYDDADGYPLLGFVDGQWYDVTSRDPEPITVRYAIHLDPAWAGAVVQTVCMWMRSNPQHDRAFELATELALAVGELARLTN